MVTLTKYFLNQRYSFIGLSVVLFLLFTIMRGNDERVGLGFLSLNAIPSFLIIILGLRPNLDFQYPFTKICVVILAFTLISFVLNSETIIPLYSIAGNIFLCLALAQAFNMPLFKLIVDALALLLSFVFVSYYFGSFWTSFIDEEFGLSRLSYLKMNPNGVSEFITISVVSIMFLVFKIRRSRFANVSFYLIILALLSVVPLLQTASRKGFFLFCFCILIFIYLKYRWYELKRLVNVLFLLGLFGGYFFIFSPAFKIASAETLSHRLQGEQFSIEAGYRYDIAYRSIKKGLEKPFFGHGLESSRDQAFLKSIGLWNEARGTAINSHNGLINIFLKGGLVYLTLHLLMFAIPMYQLLRYIRALSKDSLLRDQLILCFVYIIIFIGHIVSSGNGELYKLGWLLLGCAVGLVWHVKARTKNLKKGIVADVNSRVFSAGV